MHSGGDQREQITNELKEDLDKLLGKAQSQIQKINREIKKLSDLQLLVKAEQLVDKAVVEVNRFSHEMIPDSLIDYGLISIIEELAATTEGKNGLNFELHFPSREPNLTDLQLVNIYRILLEIVNNVIHHAQASTLYIKLEETPTQLYLFVADDGKGFDTTKIQAESTSGIKRIRARIKYLNGSLELISLPGHRGTNYNIQLPIEDPKNDYSV